MDHNLFNLFYVAALLSVLRRQCVARRILVQRSGRTNSHTHRTKGSRKCRKASSCQVEPKGETGDEGKSSQTTADLLLATAPSAIIRQHMLCHAVRDIPLFVLLSTRLRDRHRLLLNLILYPFVCQAEVIKRRGQNASSLTASPVKRSEQATTIRRNEQSKSREEERLILVASSHTVL